MKNLVGGERTASTFWNLVLMFNHFNVQTTVTSIFASLSVGTEVGTKVPVVAPCVNSVRSYVNMHVHCVSLRAWTNHIFIYT